MHVHLGFAEFLSTAALIIVFGFLWRTAAAQWKDNAFGQAMAFIY